MIISQHCDQLVPYQFQVYSTAFLDAPIIKYVSRLLGINLVTNVDQYAAAIDK